MTPPPTKLPKVTGIKLLIMPIIETVSGCGWNKAIAKIVILAIVITSYSIHYTKLYEKLLINLSAVLDALDRALEDGEITDAEASEILSKGKPLIEQGRELVNNPAFYNLKNLVETYK